ncbi:unnamed protein product [Phaedon cochleariae]|uniref:Histone acetyltransferase n=1 Tax=Phaedon cochleariae TaxID=80249 RepID=A0A9N9X1Z8_PHACE|nr:unnamed protein product [Phaedon cochleariae]
MSSKIQIILQRAKEINCTIGNGKIGSPEKPLSDLGLISYRSYWKDVLLSYLCSRAGTQLSVKDISQEMAIHSYDIVSTLQALGMMKYWKGKHIILKKQDVLDEYVERVKKRGMAIHPYDNEIVSTLQALDMMKYWKGKHIILKKHDVLDEYVESL